MRYFTLTLLAMIIAIGLHAQSWNEIKSRKDIYLFGEGRGETVEEADERALQNLISQISVAVSKEFTMTEEETVSTTGAESTSYAQSKVKSYSSATLTNTEQFIIQEEPVAIVGRCIKRTEIDKIFQGRRDKVKEYVDLAIENEERTALDNALRLYYWASTLLKTLPNPNEVKYTTADGKERVLSTWIPQQMDRILEGIKVQKTRQEGNKIDLLFTYNGKRVSSLDYTFNDGKSQSALYSAKDGRGEMDLYPGAQLSRVRITFEYRYKSQAKNYDREVADALAFVTGGNRKKAVYVLNMEGEEQQATTAGGVTQSGMGTGTGKRAEEIVASVHIPSLGEVTEKQKHTCKESVDRIVAAIRSKNYQSVQTLFTSEGYEIFLKLMQYGNARVLEQREMTYSKMDKQIVVRSVPMSFQFRNGAVKSFVEEVVFTCNADGKVDNITFGLGDVATADIMGKTIWREEVRMMLINFLEVYKTAFALKNLEYIESVFDDNAVIITGRVTMKKNNADADKYSQNRYVVRTQYTKEEYLRHLRASFASKEFINIRFAHTFIQKAQNQDIYGIQLRQDYYSSNYGDSGYLYLQVDMTNRNEPIIKVRTWQDQYDPELGRQYGMEDF